ncbi:MULTISPECIES: ABC transporter ATP-binding protein [unclassified Neisseria]|uniref:ABC transporter ATP-binding protein n=1 Tax=unclassified Neisseria TaxID=2623750 RepID=UPI001071613D|nr:MULTISPECIES: ATP-binding cassette domain-containing protein [unclassified Neisseria]MBF0803940.1 ATP-binding cassette domain-containing protein [Neisseria sp. 19428wB4_WF04]TFU43367.1 ATP-binding cassette domain-containing protein [Neisseria sp. WF04]
MFRLNHLSFALPQRTLLHNINLQFQPNRVYGLIGHNGSGKSTLLKLLTRQIKPSEGSLLLDNRPIDAYSAREYARQTAYLPQHLPTATSLTARELVAMGRYAWSGLLGRSADDQAAVEEAFALTHTQRFADQIVDTLSGGERSRIWLAMCLAQQSRFLLLDEPLAALDIAHQIEVMALVHSLSRRLNLGIIIVIHDINLAAQYCDELIALKQGRLLKQGQPSEIMTAAVLKEIYSVEMNIIAHPHSGRPVALP